MGERVGEVEGNAVVRAATTNRPSSRKALGKAAEWGKAHDRPMFLGEFGAYQAGDMASRARWTRCVAREAEKAGLSWAYWEFCSGFGAYDPKAGAWRERVEVRAYRMTGGHRHFSHNRAAEA